MQWLAGTCIRYYWYE